ncbi:MAG: pitrilysin family protein [Syntrophales bacterium]|nr:pitrilysin family protein [Syntrophales bacterium]MDD5641002.1 pitrilysin family protein [Syntrophales bacterium]
MDRLNKAVALGVILTLVWTGAALGASSPKVLGVREKLPNGLVWLFSEQTGLPLVTFSLLVKAGTLQDPQGKEGLANLTAVLLRSGTKKRAAAQIAAELDFLGARLGASGGDDYAQLSLTVLKKDLAAGLEIFQDVLLNPVFAPQEVTRKVAEIQASLKSDEDEPMVVAARTFNKDLFGAFPYGHPIRGTKEGLAAITPKDLVEFHRRYYRPNNAILCVAGDLTLEEARKWVAQILGSWPAGEIPAPQLPPVPTLKERKVVLINKDISQANIILGNMGISRDNPDFYALQVMNYILGGGGFASRLMENIRVQRGLAYSVGSQFDPGLKPGYFAVSLETKNASAAEAVEQVLAEMKRIREKPVTPEELQDAKSYLIGSFPRKMDSLSKRAWLMGYTELYGLGLDYPWRYPQLMRDLTPADIQKAAWKYLHPEKFLLVVVGKKSEIPSLFGSKAPAGKEEKKDAQTKPHH